MAVKTTQPKPRRITGHVMYLGPHVGFLGLNYNKTFLPGGIDEQYYPWIDRCPALGELFVPVEQIGPVMRELQFDIAHNMRGTKGPFVTFYREVQKWLATLRQSKSTARKGVNIEKHQHA
jgi:hypothetical protein